MSLAKQDQRETRDQVQKIVKSIILQDNVDKQVIQTIQQYLKTYIRNIVEQGFKRSLKRDPSSNSLSFNDLLWTVKDNKKAMHRLARSLIMSTVKDRNISATKNAIDTSQATVDYDEKLIEDEQAKYMDD